MTTQKVIDLYKKYVDTGKTASADILLRRYPELKAAPKAEAPAEAAAPAEAPKEVKHDKARKR